MLNKSLFGLAAETNRFSHLRTDMGGSNATRSVAEGASGIVWLAADAPQHETGNTRHKTVCNQGRSTVGVTDAYAGVVSAPSENCRAN
jgi:hypothetical protein